MKPNEGRETMLKRLIIGFVTLTFLTTAWTVVAQDEATYQLRIKNLTTSDVTIELEGLGELTVAAGEFSEIYQLPDENVSLSYPTADGGFGFTATAFSGSNEGVVFLLPVPTDETKMGEVVFSELVTTPAFADMSRLYLLDSRETEFGETGISFYEITWESGSVAVSAETLSGFGEPTTLLLSPGQYTVTVYVQDSETPVVEAMPVDTTSGGAAVVFNGTSAAAYPMAALQ
jgi:hypothetical protein